jgi:ABC-type oligopeptide transport system ATPase subunit
LVDELVSALDMKRAGADTQPRFLADLQRDLGVASIFISHDPVSSSTSATRSRCCFIGSIVETGETDQVMNRPTHDYTRNQACAPRPR